MGKREGNGQLAAAEPCHPYSVPTYGKLNGLYVQFCSNFLLKSESKKHANEQSPLFLRSGWDFFIGFSNNIRREVDSITPLLRKAAALYISIRGPTLSLSLSLSSVNKQADHTDLEPKFGLWHPYRKREFKNICGNPGDYPQFYILVT